MNLKKGILLTAILFFLNPVCASDFFEEEIFADSSAFEFNFENKLPPSFKQSAVVETSGLEIQKGGVSFFSKARKELNDYMTNDYKTQTGAVLNPNGRLSLTGGFEIKHKNPNAKINSKNVFLTPALRLNESVFVTFSNKINNETRIYENELGLKYSPKIFKKRANFQISTGSKYNEETLKSRNLKFSTELFVF